MPAAAGHLWSAGAVSRYEDARETEKGCCVATITTNSNTQFQHRHGLAAAHASTTLLFLQVTNALTRQKKEQIVTELTGKLENSVIVFGLRFKGLNVSALGLVGGCQDVA